MFFLSGMAVAILTFPGVIVHEAAHRLFCDLAGVRVLAVCYFQPADPADPAGYVVHERTASLPANFLISVGPMLVNTALCMALCFAPLIVLATGDERAPGVNYALLWLGLSIGMHAFPSGADMANFRESVRDAEGGAVLRGAAAVLAGVFALANALRFVWFDLIYAVSVAWLLPALVLGAG